MFKANYVNKCPHCRHSVRFEPAINANRGFHEFEHFVNGVRSNQDDYSTLGYCKCPECNKLILSLDDNLIYPLGSSRPPCPPEVPTEIKEDYDEACLVESISKKAAAALSRRCLQNMLHNQGIKKRNLNDEIEEAMKTLPHNLAEDIDAIRHMGNFAAHALKYESTGQIVDVEDGEVEWSLEVLFSLFDFYYVKPAKSQLRREKFNKKLEEAGKPLLKKLKK